MDIIGKNITQSKALKTKWNDVQRLVLSQMGMHGPWVAGGAARRLFNGRDLGGADMDVFCQNAEQVLNFGAWMAEQGAAIKVQNENNTMYDLGGQLVQLIHGSTYCHLINLFESFDFCLCQFATDGSMIWYTFPAETDNKYRSLTINKISIPLRTLARVAKYEDQGFTASEGTLMQLARAAQKELELSGRGGSTGC